MTENQYAELTALLRGLTSAMLAVAQELADAAEDRRAIASHLTTISKKMEGQK